MTVGAAQLWFAAPGVESPKPGRGRSQTAAIQDSPASEGLIGRMAGGSSPPYLSLRGGNSRKPRILDFLLRLT
jgi:hypothetical protein